MSASFPTNTFIRNYLMGNPIQIDMSSFLSSDLVNYPGLTFAVSCPTGIFANNPKQQAQQCQMQPNQLYLSTNNFPIVAHQKYNFTF